MNNTVEALKGLYVALGGSAEDVAELVLIPEVITAMTTLVSAGLPGSLPEVKKADAGKVLTVNSQGKWAAANPSNS